eukprot:2870823-Prorocentrum_lima.AAC.1
MQYQGKAVVIHCRDNFCHDILPVRRPCDSGKTQWCTDLPCNLGLKHSQNKRPIKLRKKILTTAELPRLDR